MKDVILALTMGAVFIYEMWIFIKTRAFVKVIYMLPKDSEEKLAIKFVSGCFSLIYLVWLILGMALSDLWYAYLAIFTLSILQSFVTKYLKKNKHWESLILFKKIDGVISMAILVWLFVAHFHPELLGSWKINF
jgi:TRAP-type uncharacterized transport system fused permease subunit